MALAETLALIAPDVASSENASGGLALAQAQLSEKVFGGQYELAVAYLAAHMLTIGKRGGGASGGQVKSIKEGELQISYTDAGASQGADLGSTPYGAEFLRIRRSVVFTPMTSAG